MSKTMYNCPNCSAPIGYNEACPYCGTALDWVPTVHMTIKAEKREIRKCRAVFMNSIDEWTPKDFIDDLLKQQIGQAATEVWKRETVENRKDFSIGGIPPHTARHTATVYFAVMGKEGTEE